MGWGNFAHPSGGIQSRGIMPVSHPYRRWVLSEGIFSVSEKYYFREGIVCHRFLQHNEWYQSVHAVQKKAVQTLNLECRNR